MFCKSGKQRKDYINLDVKYHGSQQELTGIKCNHKQFQSLNNIVSEISEISTPDNQSTLGLSAASSLCLIKLQPTTTKTTTTTTTTIKTCCGKKGNFLLTVYCVFYVLYLIVGALSFQSLETPLELTQRALVNNLRSEFLLKHSQLTDAELEEFLQAIISANDRGISPLHNASNDMNWSFGQAFLFSGTVVTTIGYGRVTPLSQTGKIFCIIYAAIGIPLTLVLLSAVVERLLIPANWLLGVLNTKLGHLYQPFNIRLMHLSLIVLLVAVLFFAIPTTIFALLEPDWGPLDAFYYCFISLTTVGLGDYIPGDGVSVEHRSFYKMLITGYLVLGIIAMMFVLTIFYDIPQLNLGQLFTESTNVGETEKLRLSTNSNTCYSGPSGLYMPQRDEETQQRAVVRIRPHGNDDSPSPEEPLPPAIARLP